MYETIYHRPSSVDEAAALFAKGAEAKYLAGGHTLIPVMKQRLASPSDGIDLGKIKDLIGIEVSAEAVPIQPATAHYSAATRGPRASCGCGAGPAGDRGGAEGQLVGGGAGQRHDFRQRAFERSAGNVGLSRQPDQGDGAARGHRSRVIV